MHDLYAGKNVKRKQLNSHLEKFLVGVAESWVTWDSRKWVSFYQNSLPYWPGPIRTWVSAILFHSNSNSYFRPTWFV